MDFPKPRDGIRVPISAIVWLPTLRTPVVLSLIRMAALTALLALPACVPHAQPPDLSPETRRSLAQAFAQDTPRDAADPASLDALRLATQAAPDDAIAQERFGLAAERARLYTDAFSALERALALGGPVTSRLLALGRISLEAGDVPAAMRAYNRVLETDPNNADALSGLGVVEDLRRQHTEAQAHYAAALTQSPNDWGVRSNMAISLLMSGHPAGAVTTLAGAETDPLAPRRTRHDLALALVATGNRGHAIAVLRADMTAAEAAAAAEEFNTFAKWLASPIGGAPSVR